MKTMPPSAKAFKLVGDVRTSLTSAREKGLKLGEGEVELVVAMQGIYPLYPYFFHDNWV